MKFNKLPLSKKMLTQLDKLGFNEATEVQQKAIPLIMEDKHDVVAIAQTGTGKTGAFGIPIVDIINSNKLPQVIVLAPTRELALQVTKELGNFAKYKELSTTTIYGGASISTQIKALKKGVDIVVGTPGRVVDLIQRGELKLQKCSHVVLDEADEMLKMGFIEDLEFILSNVPKKRKVYLFSATMPPKIQHLSKNYQHNQKIIEVKRQESTSNLIEYEMYKTEQGKKFNLLLQILQEDKKMYSIIFCRTKSDVDNVTNSLQNNGFKACCIHGDIAQAKRERILKQYKDKQYNILIATDVAARGIHVNDITHVINYSMPQDTETFTHRVGRTGRAGKSGVAISFVTRSENRKIRDIEAELGIKFTEKKPLSQEQLREKQEQNFEEEIEKVLMKDKKISPKVKDLAKKILEHFSAQEAIEKLLQDKIKLEPQTKAHKKTTVKGNSRLFIAKGKIDKLNKKSLVQFLERETGISLKSAQDVKICDTFSFISINGEIANQLIEHYSKKSKKRPLVELASS